MNAAAQDRPGRPPLDQAVVTALRQDFGDEALQSFIETYIDLLISRLVHIDRAVGRQDCTDALRDVPDLRTSSAMLGAGRLAKLAEALQYFLVRGMIAAAAGLLPGIRTEAAAAVAALRAVDGRRADPHPPNL